MTRRTVVFTVVLALLLITAWPALQGGASAPGPNTSGNAVSRLAHILDIAWVASNGSVQWVEWSQMNGWLTLEDGGAGAVADPGSTEPTGGFTYITRRADRMDLLWIEQDGSIGRATWDRTRTLFERWRVEVDNIGAGYPASLTSGLASISRYPDVLDAFWISQDGSLIRAAFDQAFHQENWKPAESLTAAEAADPGSQVAAVSPLGYPDQMVVFWVAPDGRLASIRNRGMEEWQSPELLTQADAASPNAGLAALARKTDHLDVFWIAPDGAVQTLSWSPGGWQPNPILVAPADSADPASGLAAIAPDPHRMEVFWIREDGAVLSASTDDAEPGWVLITTPLAPPGSAGPGGAVAAVARTPADRDVFWITPEGALGSVKRDRAFDTWLVQPPIAAVP
jgi:hypothetical protein